MYSSCVENKRVLLVGNFLSSKFSRAVCEDLAVRLSAAGWAVLTTSNKINRVNRLLDMVGTAWSKRHQYAIAQVDVFSGSAFFWAETVCSVLRKAGKPYILTLRGGNLPDFAQFRQSRVRRLLNSAVVVTTPSRYLLEQMQSYCKDLYLLNNPLDLRAYEFTLREKVKGKLIWLRAFHEIYNPSLAARTLALLVEEFPEINLTMIGPDKGDGSLQLTQKLVRELGLSSRVNIVGGISKQEVPEWICQGDVFINTTNIDNAPISVLEAMACGLPVVSTDVGGIPYLLSNEEDALLVPPNSPEVMAAAIRRLLTDSSLAGRLSQHARQKVEQYDWSIVLPTWEALLKSLPQECK